MNNSQLPKVSRIYQNHTLDSTRWDHYTPRAGDIIVTTSYKSGTSWMQDIVLHLIYQGQEIPNLMDVSPWVDARFMMSIEELKQILAQENRRCLKAHIPLDGLPYYPQVKYIVVGRDARDVFMSWWNHYSNYTADAYDALNNIPGRVGPPIPRCPQDIRDYWRTWISKGWFEWESEGYPHSGNMHHTQTWWNYRHLNNILFVHFNDLLENSETEIARVAHFLDIAISDADILAIAESVSLTQTRERVIKAGGELMREIWKGGANTFYYKGTNGRWKDILTAADLELYDKAVARVLSPDCAQWLEKGRSALI
ncbi:MAG: sulfotransferase domain-containing protein [Caldilineaceae bacterium]|nr:sulfotransferase domain-containing protein [Caldilineaceae bacterium]